MKIGDASVFAFRAIARDGSFERGTLDATSAGEARETLVGRGLFVLALESKGVRRERRDPLPTGDLALGLRILANLLESGLPVSRALQAFDDLAPRAWRAALPAIRQRVREGKGLAAALAEAPLQIPPLVIGIAQAGEAGTGIGPAIRRAAELTEATAEMQAAVRSALAYPVVVAAAGVCAIGVLITVVLPRFARILADLGQTLPPSTQLVLRGADLAHAMLLPGFFAVVVAFAVWRAWVGTPEGRVLWHQFLLAVPGIGVVRRRTATARMAHSLAALLESGVPIGAAIGHAARASGDAGIEARLLAARERVSSGQPLSQALDAVHAVGPTTAKLVRAGEETGQLPSMLTHAAKIEQQGADQVVKTAVRMLEPVLLLTFASVVALIAAALLQAIYSVRPTG
jgi:general secretion pathway protein F